MAKNTTNPTPFSISGSSPRCLHLDREDYALYNRQQELLLVKLYGRTRQKYGGLGL